MLPRLTNLSTSNSCFLIGARGTGKTSLLKALFSDNTRYIDLLNLDTEAAYQLDPEQLVALLRSEPQLSYRSVLAP